MIANCASPAAEWRQPVATAPAVSLNLRLFSLVDLTQSRKVAKTRRNPQFPFFKVFLCSAMSENFALLAKFLARAQNTLCVARLHPQSSLLFFVIFVCFC